MTTLDKDGASGHHFRPTPPARGALPAHGGPLELTGRTRGAPALTERRAPAWVREVETSLSLNPQVLLYGNVRDRYLLPDESVAEESRTGDGDGWTARGLLESVWSRLAPAGYQLLLVADVIDGLRVIPDTEQAHDAAASMLGRRVDAVPLDTLDDLRDVLVRVVASRTCTAALLIDYASRLVLDPTRLSESEHRFFAACEKLSHVARPLPRPGQVALYNTLLWVANHERDLPPWLTAANEAIRKIAIPAPDFGDRLAAAALLTRDLPAAAPAPGSTAPGQPRPVLTDPEAHRGAASRFAEGTQGLTIRGMIEIVRLARGLGNPLESLEDATRCYRVGVLDNPWRKHYLRERLTYATERIGQRVRGQDEAVQRSIDILVRSVLGLSGAHASANTARPRGVLFFAGPTGVGKTELAKSLSELVFGDERAYIRFDMSEFAAEHAAERLIGAPPGYVGHDAGGELTNAVREQPFSLILFDEVEKAHFRILDKFLQILDDGRLTDGSGSTVFFSEAVLVFTSNLGMTVLDERGNRVPNVTLGQPRSEIEARVTGAVQAHFRDELNRPELLNRLGDNIVVFNFIDREAAEEIFDLLIGRIVTRVRKEQDVELTFAPAARERLLAEATADLSLGGRGIGSVLESVLINPLARALFLLGPAPSRSLNVTDVRKVNGAWTVTLV